MTRSPHKIAARAAGALALMLSFIAAPMPSANAEPGDALAGVWNVACVANQGTSLTGVSQGDGERGVTDYSLFGDLRCDPAFLVLSVAIRYRMSHHGTAEVWLDTEKVAAERVQYIYESVVVTPGSPESVRQFNSRGFCGRDDWEYGVAVDVTEAVIETDGDAKQCGLRNLLSRDRDVLHAEPARLYLGDPTQGLDADGFPKALDTTLMVTRETT